jgi:hypothetical protein
MDVERCVINAVLLLIFLGHSVINGYGTSTPALQAKPTHQIAELAVSSLVEAGKEFEPKSFDISPDGRELAILYSSWGIAPHRSPSELWLSIWDIPSRKTVQSIRVIRSGEYQSSPKEAKRVIFTADQAHIFVLAQERLWVVNPKGGDISALDASNPALDAPVSIQALSGPLVAVTYSKGGGDGFYTQFLDASTSKATPGWSSSRIPQSFSPNGNLAVALAVGEWNSGGVAGLQLIDTTSGAKLKSIAVKFGFPWSLFGQKTHGGVVAYFLDNQRIVVCPDHMLDQTGHHSGYDLEIIDVTQNRVIGKTAPPSFVPVGQLVVSQDRSYFAVYSISASTSAYRTESLNPKDFKHEIFVFTKDGTAPHAVIEEIYAGFGTYSGDSMRFSANGSLLAVADGQAKSVRVFEIPK